ncbi:MAG: hypothetical protein ACFFAN_08745 [Promethearchaeota archaeon]
MAAFGLMFDCREGGDSVPIKWGKESLTDDRSIIILDESSQAIWLWHGRKQGLVARRTALRQAESLKGHGYTVGKSIIGRDIKAIKEIDQRKIGRDPETDEFNEELQKILKKNYQELDNFIINFSIKEYDPRLPKSEPKPATSQPITKPSTTPVIASEYDTKEPLASTKPITAVKREIVEKKTKQESPIEEARVAFVIKAILDHFDDVWVSKKKDGSYAVEMMEGPVCQFSIREGNIKFTANSFSNISPTIKSAIQKKYIELGKTL